MNAFSTIKTAINNNKEPAISRINRLRFRVFIMLYCRLTKKAEPPPTNDVNRDSGTDSANGGWLRRLVRHQRREIHNKNRQIKTLTHRQAAALARRATERELNPN